MKAEGKTSIWELPDGLEAEAHWAVSCPEESRREPGRLSPDPLV